MKTLVFGSLNIDRTYTLDHFVQPGETITADRLELFCGGKGFNQTIALARAGAEVSIAGAVGTDGDFLLAPLAAQGVDVSKIKRTDGESGHAVIQVNRSGGNSIIILAGANGSITHTDVDHVLKDYAAGDRIVLQNEISSLDYLLKAAHAKGMTVVLNPSPFNAALDACDFECVDYLLVNEVEAVTVAGMEETEDFDAVLNRIHALYPRMNVLMTLGHRGSVFFGADGLRCECGVYRTAAVDTTAAGDCFTGFFLAALGKGKPVSAALKTAAIAAGISVSRKGAAPSIPTLVEVEAVDPALVADRYER